MTYRGARCSLLHHDAQQCITHSRKNHACYLGGDISPLNRPPIHFASRLGIFYLVIYHLLHSEKSYYNTPIVCILMPTQEVNMSTTRKTITLTDQQDQWIKAQIAAGEYTNDSEYIRDLVRRDQEQNAKFRALKAAIQEGLDSGITNKTVRDVWEEAEARYRAKHG